MSDILSGKQNERWALEAAKSAREIKKREMSLPDRPKLGFVFNDAVVTVTVNRAEIITRSEKELAEYFYQLVISEAQKDKAN